MKNTSANKNKLAEVFFSPFHLRISKASADGYGKEKSKAFCQILLEFLDVFKDWISKAALHLLESDYLPDYIRKVSEKDLLLEVKQAVKRGVGIKLIQDLKQAVENSVGPALQ